LDFLIKILPWGRKEFQFEPTAKIRNSREGIYLTNNDKYTLSHFSDVQARVFTSKNFSLQRRDLKFLRIFG